MRLTVIYENHAGFVKGLLGGHGFSALLEHRGRRVLIDTGTDGEVLLSNMTWLGIDPGEIDFVFITHGHYDHTGGLKAFLNAREEPVRVIAHPGIFRRRVALKPHRRDIGIPFDRRELEGLGAEFILKEEPFEFAPGLWSSGEIPRRTWDRAVGYVEENGSLIRDPIPDDIALIIDLGNSVAVVTGCGHSGVLNIAWHAEDVLGKPVRALIGGLHLRGAKKELLNEVVERIDAERLYAGHCTGLDEYAFLKAGLGERIEQLYVGRVIEL
ncbi:MBL fold metallo-hydrolase [Thermococcus camini]|uniref:MBL fold metallo-hydrolase n=1 Tax=Thermococcus camini TaxID=2016373 RepID=A0A7G2D5P4_9EURY|nr:MBL fold metallo-hydrolase [Thermococcus camini]CAD5243875.1 MBL fold metallo-hydrolase [Thermococcus camini]